MASGEKGKLNMVTQYIFNVKVNFVASMQEVLKRVDALINNGSFNYICTTNPEFILAAQKDAEFKDLINKSDLSLPDGSGLLFAKKYLEETHLLPKGFYSIRCFFAGIKLGLGAFLGKVQLDQKVTGVSLVDHLCKISCKNDYTIYLLGGWPKSKLGKPLLGEYNVAQEAAEALRSKYPGINIVGASSKYKYTQSDDEINLREIHSCMKDHNLEHIDIILVAYGHGNQEKWLTRNGKKVPVRLGVGVGGTFDYLAGYQSIPSEYIKSNNLEWLYRLFTQPWRISRILKAFPLFPILVYLSSIKQK